MHDAGFRNKPKVMIPRNVGLEKHLLTQCPAKIISRRRTIGNKTPRKPVPKLLPIRSAMKKTTSSTINPNRRSVHFGRTYGRSPRASPMNRNSLTPSPPKPISPQPSTSYQMSPQPSTSYQMSPCTSAPVDMPRTPNILPRGTTRDIILARLNLQVSPHTPNANANSTPPRSSNQTSPQPSTSYQTTPRSSDAVALLSTPHVLPRDNDRHVARLAQFNRHRFGALTYENDSDSD